MYELTGKIKRIGELQTFPSGFSKRELVVEEEHGGEWPNLVAFAFKKERASLLDGLAVGTRVKVGFALDGREWKDPTSGTVKCFCDLSALKLEVVGSAAAPSALEGTTEDDIPF